MAAVGFAVAHALVRPFAAELARDGVQHVQGVGAVVVVGLGPELKLLNQCGLAAVQADQAVGHMRLQADDAQRLVVDGLHRHARKRDAAQSRALDDLAEQEGLKLHRLYRPGNAAVFGLQVDGAVDDQVGHLAANVGLDHVELHGLAVEAAHQNGRRVTRCAAFAQ